MRNPSLLFIPKITALMALAAGISFSQSSTDARFGTVGPNNGDWQWYRGYNQDYADVNSSSVPAAKRLYTVGKLDDAGRHLASGEDWCSGGTDFLKCDRSTQSREKQLEIYNRIFEYDKDGIKRLITEFNRNYGSGPSENNYHGATQLHITVGNEPNWHPYVHPEVYAAIFKKYYDYIKGPGPNGLNCSSCVIHNGGVILSNFDLSAVPETWLEVSLVWIEAMATAAVNAANKRLDYMTWTRIFLEELLAGLKGRYDIFDVHAYEIDLNWNGIATSASGLDNLPKFIQLLKGGSYQWGAPGTIAASNLHCVTQCGGGTYYGFVNDVGQCITFQTGFPIVYKLQSKCEADAATLHSGHHIATRFPYEVPNPVIWIDEFGLLKDGGSQAYAQTVMSNYVAYFKSQPNIHKWFWYKDAGNDEAIFGNKVLRSWSAMDWESDQIALYSSTNPWTRTALGNKYLSLQDPAFVNDNYPRLSFDPPNISTYFGIAKWSVDPKNIVLMWDFANSADASAWGVSGQQQFADGMRVTSYCPTHELRRVLTASEIALADAADYFVVEKGLITPSNGTMFNLTFRNKTNTASTVQVGVGAFASNANALAAQGMPAVVDIKAYKPAGYELSIISYQENVSYALCPPQGDPRTHDYARAYFAINNPVPVIGSSSQYYYSGLILEKEIPSGEESQVPINLNTQYCTNCTVTLDAGSAAKGMSISGQYLVWRPTLAQVGVHTGTLTVNIGGTNITKKFAISVRKGKSILAAIFSLLVF